MRAGMLKSLMTLFDSACIRKHPIKIKAQRGPLAGQVGFPCKLSPGILAKNSAIAVMIFKMITPAPLIHWAKGKSFSQG